MLVSLLGTLTSSSSLVKMNLQLLIVFVLASLFEANAWDGKVAFQDEFDGTFLDRNKWHVDTGCAPCEFKHIFAMRFNFD